MIPLMRMGLFFGVPLMLLGQTSLSTSEAMDAVATDAVAMDAAATDAAATDPEAMDPDADARRDEDTSDMPHRDGMVLVPAGAFWRGSCNEYTSPSCKPGEPGYATTAAPDYMSYDESPMRQITLDAYYLDTYEVTVAAFEACVTAGGCSKSYYDEKGRNQYCNMGYPDRLNHPMNCVNWYGANQYCKFVGKRLPTEAEWEKGARGTDVRKFPWGNTTPDCTYRNACGCESLTTPVGSYPKGVSPYGAYDMSGNVNEWVLDTYSNDYYVKSPDTNPQGPSNEGAYRVHRGVSYGSYSECSGGQRTADRTSSARWAKVSTQGFRCVANP